MELKDRLRHEMVRTGHTQKSLGTAVGVSQEAIQKILSGKTKEPKKIFEIATELGVTVGWLKTGENYRESGMLPQVSQEFGPTNHLNHDAILFSMNIIEENVSETARKTQGTKWLARIFHKLYDAYFDEELRALPTEKLFKLIE